MENFIIIISFLLAGVFIKKSGKFPDNTGSTLNLYVIYFSLPALILLKIPEIDFNESLLIAAVIPWIALIFSSGLILFLSKTLKWDRESTGCMLLLVGLGNTAFLGIPMVKTFFDQDAVSYAIFYDQLGTFLCFSTFGALVISIYSKNNSKLNLLQILKGIVLFPPFIAFAAAIFLSFFDYPKIFTNILKILADTLIPLVMVAVGYQLSFKLDLESIKKLITGLFIKLILVPVFILFITVLFGFNGIVAKVAVFQSGMPPMVIAGSIAIMADLNPKLSAALVGGGIIFGFITLPIIYNLIVYFI